MRSRHPMPGNSWPHDMTIEVEDHAVALLELLWAREAWGLDVVGDDLPPRLAEPVAPLDRDRPSDADGADGWAAAWPALWHAALAHAGKPRDHDIRAFLRESSMTSEERADLLGRVFGPSGHDAFGDDAFGAEFDDWNEALARGLVDAMRTRRSLDEEPERRALDALVPAWRAGLTRVVVVPCAGTFTRRVGDTALLVTAATRDDPDTYAAALRSFPA